MAGLGQEFAARGFAVARYDQRDAGESSRMPGTGSSNPFVAVARKRGSYTSEDMTDDAIAVLDALGWKRAHLFGASLGGIIAQRIALRHPDRVLSVVSAAGMPSDTSGLGAGRYVRFGMLARLARLKFPEGRGGDIQMSLALARAVASPAYPFDETATREWIEREADSGPRDTRAQSRQAGPAGTARSCARCASRPWSCTATMTRCCASAPPATPRRPSRAPASCCCPARVTTCPSRCGAPLPTRSGTTPTAPWPARADAPAPSRIEP